MWGCKVIKMDEEKPIFTKEEISDMSDISNENELIEEEDDKKDLRELKRKMSDDDLILSKLFIKCYDYLYINIDFLRSDNEKINQKLKDYLSWFSKNVSLEEIRYNLSYYNKGKNIGDFQREEFIKEKVNIHREHYLGLITFFFNIFDVEE